LLLPHPDLDLDPSRLRFVVMPLLFAQSNIFVEGVSHKIRRQIEDLERAGGVETGALTVDGVPVDTYLTRFSSPL
jgi:hypothetical protein